jgi:hypothetical protein
MRDPNYRYLEGNWAGAMLGEIPWGNVGGNVGGTRADLHS